MNGWKDYGQDGGEFIDTITKHADARKEFWFAINWSRCREWKIIERICLLLSEKTFATRDVFEGTSSGAQKISDDINSLSMTYFEKHRKLITINYMSIMIMLIHSNQRWFPILFIQATQWIRMEPVSIRNKFLSIFDPVMKRVISYTEQVMTIFHCGEIKS